MKITSLFDLVFPLETVLLSRGKLPELSLQTMPELNKKIWGIHKRKLTTIAARTSHCKSSFALQMAHDLATQGKKILFLSLEMDRVDMAERIFCRVKRIDNYELLTGKFDQYKSQFAEFIESVKSLGLVFSDCIGKSWQEIDQFIDKCTEKPDVVIVDYVQAIKAERGIKEDIDNYVSHFREMAIRKNFAGVLCSQVNRSSQDGEDKEPHLHQLKGSGILEEHSDIVILLFWGDKEKNDFQVEVAKNRNGRTGYIQIRYLPEFYLFEDKVDDVTDDAEVDRLLKSVGGKVTEARKYVD